MAAAFYSNSPSRPRKHKPYRRAPVNTKQIWRLLLFTFIRELLLLKFFLSYSTHIKAHCFCVISQRLWLVHTNVSYCLLQHGDRLTNRIFSLWSAAAGSIQVWGRGSLSVRVSVSAHILCVSPCSYVCLMYTCFVQLLFATLCVCACGRVWVGGGWMEMLFMHFYAKQLCWLNWVCLCGECVTSSHVLLLAHTNTSP